MKQLRNVHLALVTTLIPFLFAACTQQPAPQAPVLPTEFPHEDKGLISPEGQIIIDAVLDGRIEMPKPTTKEKPPETQPSTELQPSHGAGSIYDHRTSPVPSDVRHPFVSAMSVFLVHRQERSPSYANWYTNYCSFAPDSGWSFDFKNSCARHDYGYRNWAKWNAFTSSARLMIDDKMLRDMKDHCATRVYYKKPSCYSKAYIYYAAVRALGDKV